MASEMDLTEWYVALTYFFACMSCSSSRVVIPRLPTAPEAPWKRSGFSLSEAVTISPLPSTISTELTVSLKYPYLNELLSPAVPAKPPPAVIPGNSMTTGGIKPCFIVDSTRRSIDTFGSTKAVLALVSIFRTRERALISTVFSRRYAI